MNEVCQCRKPSVKKTSEEVKKVYENRCQHKFGDGQCIYCHKSLGEIFVEETSKDEEFGC